MTVFKVLDDERRLHGLGNPLIWSRERLDTAGSRATSIVKSLKDFPHLSTGYCEGNVAVWRPYGDPYLFARLSRPQHPTAGYAFKKNVSIADDLNSRAVHRSKQNIAIVGDYAPPDEGEVIVLAVL